jgi:signal transduction histidine kinase
MAMLALYVFTIALLFAVDTYNERRLLLKMENTMEAVTKAIEVAADQAQLSMTGPIDAEILQDYADKLRLRGVREIEVLNPQRTVIATSKTRAEPRGRKRPMDISITGTIGDSADAGPLREYRLIMPILSQNQKVGYVTVDVRLDDYAAAISKSFVRRVAALSGVFGVGLVVLLLLTRNFTAPIGELTAAAGRVAEGELDAELPVGRTDDVGALVATWNAMLGRLKEQRALESRLAAAERRASLGHLASGIAHEIRNPLNTIGLAVDYLRRRFRPEEPSAREEFEKTTQSLREEIARLNDLITNFLTFGKPLNLRKERLDAASVVARLAEDLNPEAKSRGIDIRVGGGSTAIVEADPGLLKSALLNVALNALQMMPSGGSLKIDVEVGPESVRIVFDDEGPGIPPENLGRIFEPYFSTREAGVGLGLAMTRKIATDHGGDLTADNRPEGGSRFVLQLPAARAAVAVPA